MKIEIYFKDEIIEKSSYKSDRSFTYKGIEVELKNHTIWVTEIEDIIEFPNDLLPFVEKVFLTADFPSSPRRKRGAYKNNGAEAELDALRNGMLKYYYRVTARGKNLQSVFDLYKEIRGGSLTPEICWEN